MLYWSPLLGIILMVAVYGPTARTEGLEGFAVKVSVTGEVELAVPLDGVTVSHGLPVSGVMVNPTAPPVLLSVICWLGAACPAKGAVKLKELLVTVSNGLLLTTRLTGMAGTGVP